MTPIVGVSESGLKITKVAAAAFLQTARPKAADLAVSAAYWNPRALKRSTIRYLIARAWTSERPIASGKLASK